MPSIEKRGPSWYARVKYRGRFSGKCFETYEAAEQWSEIRLAQMKAAKETVPKIELTKAEIARVYYRSRHRAKEYGTEHTLTLEEFRQLWKDSGAVCAISGIPFSSARIPGNRRRPFYPSLDRIDNSRGYVKGNVRLVCILANIARADYTDDILMAFCLAVVRHNPKLIHGAVSQLGTISS